MPKNKKIVPQRKAKAAAPARVQTPRAPNDRAAPVAGRNAAPAADDNAALAPDDRVAVSNLTLHELFAQQTARMIERADLSEEQKQSLLIGMSCPCCGVGGFSFTAKLKRGM
jgi:hypothetical protein